MLQSVNKPFFEHGIKVVLLEKTLGTKLIGKVQEGSLSVTGLMKVIDTKKHIDIYPYLLLLKEGLILQTMNQMLHYRKVASECRQRVIVRRSMLL